MSFNTLPGLCVCPGVTTGATWWVEDLMRGVPVFMARALGAAQGIQAFVVQLLLISMDVVTTALRTRGVAFGRLAASSNLSRFSIGDLCVSRGNIL